MYLKNYEPTGKVYLVGAGPGDPELITVRGLSILRKADVVVYDRLVNPELLAESPVHSEHIYVGKKPGRPYISQEQINHILLIKAGEGKNIVRLKGGDPFVFGRGGEECEALAAAGIPYEIVPGISSAVAAPAYAGIPVTHRSHTHSFTVVTGHFAKSQQDPGYWKQLAHQDTLIILMGMKQLPYIASSLMENGRSPDTPVAVVCNATRKNQVVVIAELGTVAQKAGHLASPATIVIGESVRFSETLSWFMPSMPEDKMAVSLLHQAN